MPKVVKKSLLVSLLPPSPIARTKDRSNKPPKVNLIAPTSRGGGLNSHLYGHEVEPDEDGSQDQGSLYPECCAPAPHGARPLQSVRSVCLTMSFKSFRLAAPQVCCQAAEFLSMGNNRLSQVSYPYY